MSASIRARRSEGFRCAACEDAIADAGCAPAPQPECAARSLSATLVLKSKALSAVSPLARAAPLIAPESPSQHDAVERVLDRAFGPGRFAKPSERVREFARPAPALSRVAVLDGKVCGACRIYEICIGDAPALFLGPLGVDPDAQHHGLGHQLVSEALNACAAAGGRVVVLMGEPRFFSPLGFTQIPQGRVIMPTPVEARRLQWIGLAAGALDQIAGAIGPVRAHSA
jgi:predicted N-acetyltransferase YhbS